MRKYELNRTSKLEETLNANGYSLHGIVNGGGQLNSMQAWTIGAWIKDKETGEMYAVRVLQSYNTAVAYEDPKTHKAVRCGHWSSTTSRQTTIWERDFL